MKCGQVQRDYIGIGGQNVRISLRLMLFHELAANTGIFIMFVEPHSPAHQAGFQEGDVIVGFNDRPVATIDELHQHLTPEQIGLRSHLIILRGHQKLVVNYLHRRKRSV